MKFYLTGITAIVFEWISKECEESVEDISKIIWKCILDKANFDDEKIKLLLAEMMPLPYSFRYGSAGELSNISDKR